MSFESDVVANLDTRKLAMSYIWVAAPGTILKPTPSDARHFAIVMYYVKGDSLDKTGAALIVDIQSIDDQNLSTSLKTLVTTDTTVADYTFIGRLASNKYFRKCVADFIGSTDGSLIDHLLQRLIIREVTTGDHCESLRGLPPTIYGTLDLSSRHLTSLEHAPIVFDYASAPEKYEYWLIDYRVSIRNCPNLISLAGIQRSVGDLRILRAPKLVVENARQHFDHIGHLTYFFQSYVELPPSEYKVNLMAMLALSNSWWISCLSGEGDAFDYTGESGKRLRNLITRFAGACDAVNELLPWPQGEKRSLLLRVRKIFSDYSLIDYLGAPIRSD
jgi:hypothetical protein